MAEPLEVFDLTVRERQVLRRICLGWPSEKIALGMGIAEVTVRGYEYGMRREVGANDRAGLMVWGLQNTEAWRTGRCVLGSHGPDCLCGFCVLTQDKAA
jgi:DNA-binding CsgD family transcriptional regulator